MASANSDIEKELFDKISKNDTNAVKNLLSSRNMKIEIYDENGMTPLQHAVFRGNKELVRLLIDQGANVNSGKHEHGYTALHFGALSGSTEICQILLENGAQINATNSVGRTPSQMAAFIGNHACVAIINNFVPKSDIDCFTKPFGIESKPKLPPHLASPLHKFVMQVNLNPVRIAINLQKCASLYENIDTVRNVLELMSQREMKRGFEANEIMSFKFHYLSYILLEISRIKKLQSSQKEEKKKEEENQEREAKKTEASELFIKKILKVVKGQSSEYQEMFLRDCIREFPNRDCTIFRQMVSTLARRDSPGALTVIINAINGQRGFIDSDSSLCATCNEEKANKKCSKCKAVQYCDRECQRLHWFVHKKSCDRLSKRENDTETPNGKEKWESINEATSDALVSEMSSMTVT